MGNSDQNSWIAGVTFLAGLWLIVAPFLLGYNNISNAQNNDVIVGIIVAAVAAVNFFWGRATNSFLPWIAALAGLWQIASPFLFGYSSETTPVVNAVILGIAIVILGGARAILGVAPEFRYGASYTSEIKHKKESDEG